MYFIIRNSDGDTYVYPRTKNQLLEELNAGEWSDVLVGLPDSDTGMWGGQAIIIKGEIVVPTPKKTIVNWDVP